MQCLRRCDFSGIQAVQLEVRRRETTNRGLGPTLCALQEPASRSEVGGIDSAQGRGMRTFAVAFAALLFTHELASAQCTTTPISVSDVESAPGRTSAVFSAPGGAGTNEDGTPFNVRLTVVEGDVAAFTVVGDDMAVTLGRGAPPLRLRMEHISTADGSVVPACPELTYWDLEAGEVREQLTIDNAFVDEYTLTSDTILEVAPVLPSSVSFAPPADGPTCNNSLAEARCAVRVQHTRVAAFEFEVELINNPDPDRRGFFIDGDADSSDFPADVIVCGDGVQEGSEACDDGNRDDFDECSNSCFVNGGGACTEPEDCVSRSCPGGFCESLCGNGSVDPGEPCDGSEGCTDTCRLELGTACTTGPACETGLCSGASNTCAECVGETCAAGFMCEAERCVPMPGVDAGVDAGGMDAGGDDAGPVLDGGDSDAGATADAGADAGMVAGPGLAGGGCSAANANGLGWAFGLVLLGFRRRRR